MGDDAGPEAPAEQPQLGEQGRPQVHDHDPQRGVDDRGDVPDRARQGLIEEEQVVGVVPHRPHGPRDDPDPGIRQPSTPEGGRQVAAPGPFLEDVLAQGPRRGRDHHACEGAQPGRLQPPDRPTNGDGRHEGQGKDDQRHTVGPEPSRLPRGDVGAPQGRIREPHNDAGQQRSRDPDGGARRVHGVGDAEETIDEDPDPPGAEHDDDEDQEASPGTHRGDAIGRACFTHAHTVKCDYSILQV